LAPQKALWRPLCQSDPVEDPNDRRLPSTLTGIEDGVVLDGPKNAPGSPEADFNQISSHHRKAAFRINVNPQIRKSAMWTRNAISAITVHGSITRRVLIPNLDEGARFLPGFGREGLSRS
jgi:hypothetical protein